MNIKTPSRAANFDKPSVWLEFAALSKVCESINLGQGYPDWSPPDFLINSAVTSVQGSTFSSYARSAGHLNLVNNISKNYSKQLRHTVHSEKEVLVTVGATQALFLSIMTFIDKNHEVIIIEPAFDIYYGVLEMAEAKIIPVGLIYDNDKVKRSNDLLLDWDKLDRSLNHNTKAIIINTPHNPTGKVFSQFELNKLAKKLSNFPDCLIISDEVYGHITYDDCPHISMASLEGMFERTLSIFSAGKTFNVTGWKIGWIIGPEDLIKRLQICQQWVAFSVATPLQEAISDALEESMKPYKDYDHYYLWLKNDYDNKRNLLYNGLKKLGFNPILPQGSFFILCDISQSTKKLDKIHAQLAKYMEQGLVEIDMNTEKLKDYNFCRNLTLDIGVTAIPVSAFYNKAESKKESKWVRFAFCKKNEVLEQALKLLENYTL